MSYETEVLKFKHPFTFCVIGPTGSGKTVFLKNLLIKHKSLIIQNVQKILYFYSIWQPIYTDILNDNPNVEFIQGYKNDCELLDSKEVNLIVLDDLMEECKDNPEIAKIFTKASHHMNLSVIFLSKNLFLQGRQTRTISLNTHYMAIFKNPRDRAQFSFLSRQMFPRDTKFLNECFNDATSEPHAYLFSDFKQNTPENLRVRTKILENNPVIYLKKK
jgi:hypothetical protein